MKTDRSTSFGTFIQVQNELSAAYTFLRNKISTKIYGISYSDLILILEKDKNNESIKLKIKKIRAMYPETLSESENS